MGADWARELRSFQQFEVAQVFIPVWRQNNYVNDLYVMINYFMKGMDEANGINEEGIAGVLNEAAATHIVAQHEAYRKMLLRIFLQKALFFAPHSDKFLSGLVYYVWMARGDDLSKMWNRNLYHRSLKRWGIAPWRKFFQEEILKIQNNEKVKEIMKSLMEHVTEVSRNVSITERKSVSAQTIADQLRQYSREFEDLTEHSEESTQIHEDWTYTRLEATYTQ